MSATVQINKAIYLKTVSLLIAVFLVLASFENSFAQIIAPATKADSTASKTDTAKTTPSANDKAKIPGIRISKDAPEEKVITSAKDSAVFDMENNMFYLFGNSAVQQGEIDVKSGIIVFDQKNNVVSAYPTFDTSGKKTSEQLFTQGSEHFKYDSLKYNFKSKRAIVRNAQSEYGEGFVFSQQVKRNPDQSIFGYRNLYTTCNLDHPHFGINAKKIKVIPGKVIASGPANLQIADLPTPLVLPFGIFPINPKQKSGFILPTYTMEDNRGLGLQRLGYYFNISEYLGAQLTFDIFSKGSYAIFNTIDYAKRYQFSGRFDFNYSLEKWGNEFENNGSTNKNFGVRWSHQVDPRSTPGSNFSINVNVGSSRNNLVNGINPNVKLDNTYTSSIAYSKSWIGKPYALSVALRHNQSTYTGKGSVTLPDVTFNISQIDFFQNKNRVGNPKWYEKISATYLLVVQNHWDFIDSTFSFKNIKFSDFRNGIKHSVSIGASYNVLKFFNFSVSVPYNEYWNTKQIFLTYNPVTQRDDTTMKMGFFATRDVSANASLNTRIYGVKMFKKGTIAGLRHVITPSINANYTPGFANKPFRYFYDYYSRDAYLSYYSPYTLSPTGFPTNAKPIGSLGFSLNNNLQMKVRQKDSGTTKNINLIDGLGISGNYNFFADSNNVSPISFNGSTSISNMLSISVSGTFDTYLYKNGRRTAKFLINDGGSIAQLRNFNLGLDFNFDGGKKADKDKANEERKGDEVQRLLRNNGIHDYYDFNIPWTLNVRASLNYERRNLYSGKDTVTWTPNLSFNGSIRFTPKMMLSLTSGYDFVLKEIGYSNINITRDLHCWQMMLSLSPFGYYRSFNFTLNVKSAVLQDLKLVRRRAYQDNF